MITHSFSLLAFDFTTASLDPRITFTRTTGSSNPATYVDNTGVIDAATNNQPRFDYDPITLICKGLLIEESRTNLLLQSQTLNSGSWSNIGVTINVDAATAPDGTATADVLRHTNTGVNYISQSPTVTSGSAYTFSAFFAPPATNPTTNFYLSIGGTTATINTTTTPPTLSGAGILTEFKDGYYRYSVTVTASSTTLGCFLYPSVGRNIGNGVVVWGAQLEAGASATSYIPTTTAALTRNADVATITGSNFSDFWQAGKGGAQVMAIPGAISGTRPLVQFDDGTANEIIALRGNAANPELYIVDGGTPQVQLDAGTITANASHTLTGWWDTNDCRARYDSGATVTDQTATIPTVTQMRIGSDGTNYLNGHIATIGYYDRFSGQVYSRRKNKAVFSVL